MHKEASLKTHVSLSHYLNQQRESLETLLIYLSPAPSPPPVPQPQVSSQNFRKSRTQIQVRFYQINSMPAIINPFLSHIFVPIPNTNLIWVCMWCVNGGIRGVWIILEVVW